VADDGVDAILRQWARARPDLDASPMGVVGRVSRAARILERELTTVFAAHGLQRGEFDILATLRRASAPEGMGAGSLASSAMVTSGAITNRIDRLVAKDLVTRQVDPANRRAVRISLTPSGRRLVDTVVVEHAATEKRLLSVLDDDQQRQLAALLRQLLVGLGDVSPSGARPDEPAR
jgi:DNA-binding MarR family transcriptional regulator